MPKKILIVDDDAEFVRLLALRLKSNKYDVVVAYDGLQGIERAHKEKPDLILLDMKMPAGGGMSVFDNLRVSIDTASIPVIFITAFSNEELRKKAMEKGAVDFIPKPLEPVDFLATVKKAIGE